MKVGFIGCGNMASAIICGITNSNTIANNDIYCYDIDENKTKALNDQLGINVCADETELVQNVQYVILAVKPNVQSSVLSKIDTKVYENNSVLISIAAGKTIEEIKSKLSHETKIIRVMPNINAKVNSAMSAYCFNSKVSQTDINVAETIFSSIGSIMHLDEKYFPIFGVLSGCVPAYTFLYINSLAQAGVQFGLKKDEALEIVAKTVMGSAKMVLETNEHPEKLIDNVCSPGGTTIEGIMSLKSECFEGTVAHAVAKSLEKDKKL